MAAPPVPAIVVSALAGLPAGAHVVLPGEIDGLHVTAHVVPPGGALSLDAIASSARVARVVLVASGGCDLSCDATTHAAAECSVLVTVAPVTILARGDGAALVELRWMLTPEEAAAAAAAPPAPPFFQRLSAAAKYHESFKSPTTVSRTLVPAGVVPRFAAGSVTAPGPDAVGAHAHPMLEQLFLGLPGSAQRVAADGAAHTLVGGELLHIPLGSTHGVTVDAGHTMDYLWLDFFRDASGMAWLQGHVDE